MCWDVVKKRIREKDQSTFGNNIEPAFFRFVFSYILNIHTNSYELAIRLAPGETGSNRVRLMIFFGIVRDGLTTRNISLQAITS